jgi:hypothetical protein
MRRGVRQLGKNVHNNIFDQNHTLLVGLFSSAPLRKF